MSKILAVVILTLLPSSAAMAQKPPADAPVRSFAMPSMDELRATRERPLFSPRRRPDEQVVTQVDEPVVQEAPESVPFDLTGVVIGEDRAVAILHNRDTQETVHLRQGETADVWSVAEIAQRHVVLRSEGKEVRLQLFEPKPDGEGAAAPPPPRQRMDLDNPRPRRSTAAERPSLRRSQDRQRQRRER